MMYMNIYCFSTVKKCPGRIKNGYLSPSCSGYLGTTCTYTCNSRFASATPQHIHCTEAGNWDVDVDTLCKSENYISSSFLVKTFLSFKCWHQSLLNLFPDFEFRTSLGTSILLFQNDNEMIFVAFQHIYYYWLQNDWSVDCYLYMLFIDLYVSLYFLNYFCNAYRKDPL